MIGNTIRVMLGTGVRTQEVLALTPSDNKRSLIRKCNKKFSSDDS